MANEEILHADWDDSEGLALGEIMGTVPIPADLPGIVLLNLFNHDSLVGEPTRVKRYPVFSDLGVSSALTEGTDLTTTTELAMGTAVNLTVAENAGVKAVVSDIALERLINGPRSAAPEILMSQDPGRVVQALGPQAQRMMAMNLEKVESDMKDLLSGLSNTAGGGAGVDLRVSDLLDAVFAYDKLDPQTEQTGFVLTPHQVHEVRKELATTGGGLAGSAWSQADIAAFLDLNPSAAANGLQGTFLGKPVYKYAHSLREEASSAAFGMYGALAYGAAPDQMGSVVSPFCFVEGRSGFTWYVDFNASNRWIEIICILVYATGEIKDTAAVAIKSDDL